MRRSERFSAYRQKRIDFERHGLRRISAHSVASDSLGAMANTTGTDTLIGLGSIVLTINLIPLIGDNDYLHLASVNTVAQEAYIICTDAKTRLGLSIFSSMAQLKWNAAKWLQRTEGSREGHLAG